MICLLASYITCSSHVLAFNRLTRMYAGFKLVHSSCHRRVQTKSSVDDLLAGLDFEMPDIDCDIQDNEV